MNQEVSLANEGSPDEDEGFHRHRVADVEAAIALAQRFMEENRYQWFRGQVQAWPPHSTLRRRYLSGGERWMKEEYEPLLNRFHRWLQTTPALGPVAADLDQAFAVAQHHGLPTHCIDFTTDPAVAGFFSADTAEPPPEGTMSCIYCLNLEDLRSFWDDATEALREADEPPVPPLKFLTPKVPNLWRLEAQQGVFVECGADWDTAYPMDRIEFPYTGVPAYPPREAIYPVRRSQLELLLDQFFDNEEKLQGEARMNDMVATLRQGGVQVAVTRDPHDRPLWHPEAFVNGPPPVHPSWHTREPWLALPHEPHQDVQQRQVALALDFSQGLPALRKRAQAGIEQALKRMPDARAHAVHWVLSESRRETGAALPPGLSEGLARLWDGMRNLPFTPAHLAAAMGSWVALAAGGYAQAGVEQRRALAEQVFGEPVMELEFASHDGASSRGWVRESALRAAMRPDFASFLVPEAQARLGEMNLALQMCFAPDRLFEFDALLELFASEIGPTQLNRSPPSFFHPARLRILGRP